MSEWINCGLPWEVGISVWEDREKWEKSIEDLQEEQNRILEEIVRPLSDYNEALYEIIKEDVGIDEYGSIISYEEADKHPLQGLRRDVLERRDEELSLLYASVPVFMEETRRENEWRENRKLLSFCGRELNKPGVLVEVNGKQYLLGHINAENVDAGCCCGSSAFEDKDIVTRYKVIWHQPDTNP